MRYFPGLIKGIMIIIFVFYTQKKCETGTLKHTRYQSLFGTATVVLERDPEVKESLMEEAFKSFSFVNHTI